MLVRNSSVVFLARWIDACSLWRIWFPHLSLPGSRFICFNKQIDWRLIADHDVVVVQRCYSQAQFEFLGTARALGMKIIYDLDDLLWDIPDYNPAAKILSQHRQGFTTCIRGCDLVTVSTKNLAKAVRHHVKFLNNIHTGKEIPIVVAENRLCEQVCVEPYISDRLIVGWGGSSSHVGDLEIVHDAINNLAIEFDDVLFQFRGCDIPADLLKRKNVTHELWMPVPEYIARMPLWGWSVGLAPVTDHDFNNAKSCIKMIECGYCGIPCLASWVQPYEEFVSWDPELKWLLCAGKMNWEPKIRELICDPAKRTYLGQRMRKVVQEHYSYRREHEGWKEALALLR
jgi:Glycosyl transferases group 1